MLEQATFATNLKVPNLDEAIAFYEGKLGLPVEDRRSIFPGHEDVLFRAGDAIICVERGEGGRADAPVSFEVDDVETVVAALRGRGVEPDEYDLPSIKTLDGTASFGAVKEAWVKDAGGNVVGIVNTLRSRDRPPA